MFIFIFIFIFIFYVYFYVNTREMGILIVMIIICNSNLFSLAEKEIYTENKLHSLTFTAMPIS
tara:strand:+ start:452 stop:640 length:189 start_codon:yes stop_codon:yes gene_type:complete